MAVLTLVQLAEARRGYVSGAAVGTATKVPINAGLQAIEDYFENTAKAGLGAAIEAAAPGVFNTAQKKRLVKHYLFLKFGLE